MKAIRETLKSGDQPATIAAVRDYVQRTPQPTRAVTVKQALIRHFQASFLRLLYDSKDVAEHRHEKPGGPLAPVLEWLRFGGETSAPADPHEAIRQRFFYEPEALDIAATNGIPAPSPLAQLVRENGQGVSLLFVNGIGSNFAPSIAFRDCFDELRGIPGVEVLEVPIHHIAPPEANAPIILECIDRARHPVVLMGYSKGATDILTVLQQLLHSDPQGRLPRVAAVFSLCGCILGAPAADRFFAYAHRFRRFMTAAMQSRFDELLAGVRSVTTQARIPAMRQGRFPALPYFHLAAATDRAEVPYTQRESKAYLDRIDPRNDMQLICSDTVIPLRTAVDLGVVRAHHWSIAFPPPTPEMRAERQAFTDAWLHGLRDEGRLGRIGLRLFRELLRFAGVGGNLGPGAFTTYFPRRELLTAFLGTVLQAGLLSPRLEAARAMEPEEVDVQTAVPSRRRRRKAIS